MNGYYWKHPSTKDEKLLLDTDVIDFATGEGRALAKTAFADLIKRARLSVNFDGFEPLFNELLKIQSLLRHS